MAKRIPLVFEGGEIIESKSTDTMDLNNGVVKATGGNTERKLADILADSLSVKDFGAKGDGTTDDTAAFQAAAAHGGVIYVPHGTYKLTESVQGDFISFGHPTFTGAGATVMDKNCTDLYNDYVHKNAEYLPSGTYEQIYGDKQALGKWNFKGQTIFDGAETHNAAEIHNGAETHKGAETHEGNETHGKASGTTLTFHGTENHDGTESHSGTETHTGTESHAGDETHTGNVTFGSAGSNKTIVINVPAEFNGPVDFSGMTDAQKADLLNDLITGGTGDGFEVASGKLKVKTSELIPGTATDGLAIDSNGKIKVAPSELAGTGLTGNDSTGKLTVNVSDLIPGNADDGFEIASNKLKVKPAELITSNNGLKITNGKIDLDMAAIAEALSSGDDDVDQALWLAALGLPVSLNSNESEEWFVNYEAANASDTPTYGQLIASTGMTNDDIPNGKSASSRASTAYMTAYRWGTNANYPFKTISGALTFIRTHYSLSNVDSYVTVTPRTATTGDNSYYSSFSTSSYASGGGVLALRSSNENKKVIIQRSLEYGTVAAFYNSNYSVKNFHFKLLWYGNSTTDITSKIARIVDCINNNTLDLIECEYTLDDKTKTDAAGNSTYQVEGSYDGIAQTRLIHAQTGASISMYGGTFHMLHSTNNSIKADSGAWRGALFYAEISSYIGFIKKNRTYTFDGSANTLFTATRQSMFGGYGAGSPTFNFTNFSTYKLFNCQNASGYERNGFLTTTDARAIAVPSGLTRPSDTFGSGSWYDGYEPYSAS